MPDYAPTVLTEEEHLHFYQEVHLYQTDTVLPSPLNSEGQEVRIDHWWRDVSVTGKYPGLCKMVKALLSCFHGAQVESSFSTMNDIIDSKSGNIRTDTYGAMLTVKYCLRSSKKTALQYFHRNDHFHEPVNTKLISNVRSAKQLADKKAAQQRQFSLNRNSLNVTKKQCKKTVMLANKLSRKAHMLNLKRKSDATVLSGSKKRHL